MTTDSSNQGGKSPAAPSLVGRNLRAVLANLTLWDLLARASAVVAVLLPVAGVIARWTRFVFDPTVPAQVVLAASVPELGATGFAAIWPAIPLVALAALFSSMPPRQPATNPQIARMARWTFRIILVALIGLVIQMALTFSFPSGWISTLGGLVSGNIVGRASRESPGHFGRVLPGVLLTVVAAAVAAGMAPSQVRLVDVAFGPEAALTDSQYVILGETDQVLYLGPCGSASADRRVLMVARSAVRAVRFAEEVRSPKVVTLPSRISGQPLLLGLSAICGE